MPCLVLSWFDNRIPRVGGVSGGQVTWLRGAPLATGIAAGAEGITLRLPGSLIRGRLLDMRGAPVAHRKVVAYMRNAPAVRDSTTSSAADVTDEEGRFILVRLTSGVYDLHVPGHLATSGARGIRDGVEERTLQLLRGHSIAGRLLDETDAPLRGVSVSLWRPGGHVGMLPGATTGPDGSFRFDHLTEAADYAVIAQRVGLERRTARAENVAPGTTDLVLRFDMNPYLRFTVDSGARGSAPAGIRIELVGPRRITKHFSSAPVVLPAAPAGTWKVFVQASDLDASGLSILRWIEIGEVTTGAPETTLVVPR